MPPKLAHLAPPVAPVAPVALSATPQSPTEDTPMPEAPVINAKFHAEFKSQANILKPDVYWGDRKKLEAFLVQNQNYFRFNDNLFDTGDSYVVYAATFLRGSAQEWIQPYLADYYKFEDQNGSIDMTKAIFVNWESFTKEITKVFGDVDEKRNAEAQLHRIRQTENVVEYSNRFQRLSLRAG
jgi:hypothetical protein